MASRKRHFATRSYLFWGSLITLFIVAGFLVILNSNEPAEYTRVPFQVLIVLTTIAAVALAFFFFTGPVFNINGELETANINAMLLTLLIIIQVSFFFEIVSVRNQILNYQRYNDIRKDIAIAEVCEEIVLDETLSRLSVNGISEISIVDNEGTVLYSSDTAKKGEKAPETNYVYSFGRTGQICFYIDPNYAKNTMRGVLMNLLTVLVTSIFFTVEMVLLMIRIVQRRMEKDLQAAKQEEGMISSLYYIRQIAFLFYFASRLSSAFIPVLTKSLPNPFPWLSDTTAAGLPQSAETLLTCSAIFLTTLLLEKKGWKLPFLAGMFMVASGTFMSAYSGNLVVFVLSRAVVGLGYGFCWMTLRNLSLFGRDDKEQLLGFALLNTGIYAGMNCGSSLGAIFAELFGYKLVFVISAVLTIATSLFIIRMENAMLPHRENPKPEAAAKKGSRTKKEIMIAVLFVILMIAPASIAGSYLSYYLPLYFTQIGRSITDVGRAQLLYGVVIVYGGPLLSVLIAGFRKRALKNINLIYNLSIALSLFLPGIGAGLLLPFLGAALLGTSDSYGFGVQNNYFLALPAIRKMGASRSLSVLSFIKKILEMTGPLVFAFAITAGYQTGIRNMAIVFACMAVVFMVICLFADRSDKEVPAKLK